MYVDLISIYKPFFSFFKTMIIFKDIYKGTKISILRKNLILSYLKQYLKFTKRIKWIVYINKTNIFF